MPTEAEQFLEEDLELDGSEDADTEEETQTEEVVEDPVAGYKAEVEKLQLQIQAMQSRLAKPAEEAPKKAFTLTAEQKAALKDNPELILEIVAKQSEDAEKRIVKHSQKEKWDNQAIKEFPIQKDKAFEAAVVREIGVLVDSGAMDRDNPMLVYTAAKMAMSGYKPKTGVTVPKKSNDSGLPPSRAAAKTSPNAEKDKRDRQTKTFLELAGWNQDKIQKVLAKSDQERGVMHRGNRRRRVVSL